MDLPFSYQGYQVVHNPIVERTLLAFRVMDGLFVGNFVASHDYEFIQSNKITHVINCCGNEVTNQFEGFSYEIKYLTFYWKDDGHTQLFDVKNVALNRTREFIEEAFDNGECVLVHGLNGINRCCALIAGFLILKFKWGYDKTMKFLGMGHPEMRMKSYFRKQLRELEKRQLSHDVLSSLDEQLDMRTEKEQIVLTNTFVNSLPYKNIKENESSTSSDSKKRRVHFQISVQVIPAVPYSSKRRKPTPISLDRPPGKSCLKRRKGFNEKKNKMKDEDDENSGGTSLVIPERKDDDDDQQQQKKNQPQSHGAYVDYLMKKKKKKKKRLFFIDAHNSGNSFIIEDSSMGVGGGQSPLSPSQSPTNSSAGGLEKRMNKMSQKPKSSGGRLRNMRKAKQNNNGSSFDPDPFSHQSSLKSRSGGRAKKKPKFQYTLVSMTSNEEREVYSGPQVSKKNLFRERPRHSTRRFSPKNSKFVVGRRRDYAKHASSGLFEDNLSIFPNTKSSNKRSTATRKRAGAYRKRAPTPLSKNRRAAAAKKKKQSTASLNKMKAQYSRPRARSARMSGGMKKRIAHSSAGPSSLSQSFSGTSSSIGGGSGGFLPKSISRKGRARPKSSNPQMFVSGNRGGIFESMSKKRSELIYNKYFKNLSYI